MFRSTTNKSIKLSLFVIILSFNVALFFISTYGLYRHFISFQKLEKKYKTVEKVTLQSLKERKEKADFLSKYRNGDINFITDFFENKKNLLEEQKNLIYLSKQPFFHKNIVLKNRLTAINENNFKLQIKDLNQIKNIKEKKIVLKYPIKCSYQDLNEILSKIEGNSNELKAKSPQIIPYNVYVEFNEYDCVFDCKLLQREFN